MGFIKRAGRIAWWGQAIGAETFLSGNSPGLGRFVGIFCPLSTDSTHSLGGSPFLTIRRGLCRLILALSFFVAAGPTRATTVTPPPFPQLVNESDYIVRAVVKSVKSEYARAGSRKIVSFVELDVREVIAGAPSQPLVLRVLGGKVGEDELILEGAPSFNIGEESVFFIQGNGRQMVPLVAMMHGLYPLKRDAAGREIVTRSNHEPLQNVAEVAAPMGGHGAAQQQQARNKEAADPALTATQFVQQIKAAVKPDNARLHAR